MIVINSAACVGVTGELQISMQYTALNCSNNAVIIPLSALYPRLT